MIVDMKLPGYTVPLPSFASLAFTMADVEMWLKVVTLLIGASTSVVMFLVWLKKRKTADAEERLAELKLAEAERLAKIKLDEAEALAALTIRKAEQVAWRKLNGPDKECPVPPGQRPNGCPAKD